MDGLLTYKEDGSTIGFEFKTKSNTPSQVKNIKEPQPSHIQQCVAYSLLFDVDEFLLVYEGVAKSKWSSNDEAYPDTKAFYVRPTEREKTWLLDKFAEVTRNVEDGELSRPDYSKCLFCPYKTICEEYGSGV
ncbi:PD-(D/E)XK nuclease family protein [Geomicrobium sp. JCM 19055]|uniref:PD-(D/E)XK nuclease family protein n=1 Tax=Geomicrobium sp. JCM 19055 TaxID=1460649 RepID=UPI000693CD62|nr:PD-(D/E)XK nuclease family protein [Geomicrobium sp. JCM 19055]